ncbi:DDB1- and CUL4-associated factor 17-like isoform X2 [Patiria miniata]|uniref:Uncharacterized protein n=1 Tax=Patiria miniata TaxID=46514 RepID=A0A914ABL7_PATMI|nr:DDB1- and CUL4-associated factor 17-like isoform X2 [Patiria miniata]
MVIMSDQLIWTCGKPNIALHLRDREAGFGKAPAYRRNCRMWRTLICDKSSVYKKTWSLTSKNRIYYIGDRLYLDDFRTCYSLNGLHAMPTIVYTNPDKSHTYKLEANLHCSAELNILPMVDGEHRPYVLGLTKCQNLIRIDLQTGQILKKIYLGHHHLCLKYMYLNWDVFQERAVVCSTQSKSAEGMMKSFVLFSVFPLEVIGHLTVTQQVFGADICNANVSDGMLIVMHRNDRVRMYNLDKIINENMKFRQRLGEVSQTTSTGTCSSSSGAVGSFPTGIPADIHITDRLHPLRDRLRLMACLLSGKHSEN